MYEQKSQIEIKGSLPYYLKPGRKIISNPNLLNLASKPMFQSLKIDVKEPMTPYQNLKGLVKISQFMSAR